MAPAISLTPFAASEAAGIFSKGTEPYAKNSRYSTRRITKITKSEAPIRISLFSLSFDMGIRRPLPAYPHLSSRLSQLLGTAIDFKFLIVLNIALFSVLEFEMNSRLARGITERGG
jgi:hypothetical protein